MIDSHCHLADARFDGDRELLIARACEAGVRCIVAVSAKASEWAYRPSQSWIHPAYGIHPWYCAQLGADDWDALARQSQHAIAIGECGLDFGSRAIPEDVQRHSFVQQLDIAQQHKLPVIIHSHKSVDAVIALLRSYPDLRVVMHGFCGSQQQVRQLLRRDCYFGVGGRITFPHQHRLRDVVRCIPGDRLLLESDAPDQPPFSHRAQRNEPAFLAATVIALATVLECSETELIRQTTSNSNHCFGFNGGDGLSSPSLGMP